MVSKRFLKAHMRSTPSLRSFPSVALENNAFLICEWEHKLTLNWLEYDWEWEHIDLFLLA